MAARNLFTNRESGAVVRITGVDAKYAYQESVLPTLGQKYAIPLSEYDSTFARRFRPATDEDLGIEEDLGTFRMPANAQDHWASESS